MNILFIGAHHDDLEVSIGGSVKRWTTEGHKVSSIILTNSRWKMPDGIIARAGEQIIENCEKAADLLGYTPYNLEVCDALELRYDDRIVAEILRIIRHEDTNVLITIWQYDANPDHQTTSRMALAASRRLPRILVTRISMDSVPQAYKPNFYVDITGFLDVKLRAMACYTDEFKRKGLLWEKGARASAAFYGLESNCEAAEVFETVRYVY